MPPRAAPALTLPRQSALMAIGMAIPVLHRHYRSVVDRAAAPMGLSLSMAPPLVMIGRYARDDGNGEPLRQGALAERLAIEGPSLVRALDQLEEAGFIERRGDPADRRAKTLHLTAAGTQAVARIEAALAELRDALFEGVPDADVAACLRVFDALSARLGCKLPEAPSQAGPQAAPLPAAGTSKAQPAGQDGGPRHDGNGSAAAAPRSTAARRS